MSTVAALTDAFTDYLVNERHVTRATVVAYTSDLRVLDRHLGGQRVQDVGLIDMRAYMRALSASGAAPATIRRKFHAFGTFWGWAMLEGHAQRNVPRELALPRRKRTIARWLSAEELRQWLATPAATPQHAAAWGLLAWLGLRRSELLALRVADVRLDANTLLVSGKGKQQRLLPVPPALLGLLVPLLDGHAQQLLGLGRGALLAGFARQRAAAGLGRDVTLHTFRHTVATHLVRGGASLSVVRDFLGHAHLSTTQIYLQHDPAGVQDALRAHPLSQL